MEAGFVGRSNVTAGRSLLSFACLVTAIAAVALVAGCAVHPPAGGDFPGATEAPDGDLIALPPPETRGIVPVGQALAGRRSVRVYAADPLDLGDLSQLLWAAQGQTGPPGSPEYRTAPSAGALYPLEIFAACGNVSGLPAGVYRYLPASHALERVAAGDVRAGLSASALQQQPVRDAPAVIVIAADYHRTTGKYGDRGIRYVHMEAGCASQNVYLQAYALGIGTVAIGAFDDRGVSAVLHLPSNATPLCLMPVGKVTAGIR